MKNAIILNLIFSLSVSAVSIAKTHLVPGEYSTIQAAIDAAVDGDEIVVADGIYTGNGNRDIDFLGKAITVRSENGPENCIIDCNGTKYKPHSGFYFHSGEDSNSVLDGFSIINANHFPFSANICYGVIICANNSSPIITNCIFTNNIVEDQDQIVLYCSYSSPTIENCTITNNITSSGGGIYCRYSSPAITNCIIINNYSNGNGGGIYCRNSSPTIKNSTISSNSSRADGGGIFCQGSSPTITDCIITGNSTDERGGGIYCEDTNPNITNCTICDNSAEYGGGIFCHGCSPTITNCIINGNSVDSDGGGIYSYDSSATISNCIISGNLIKADSWSSRGGGIYCDDKTIITNCIIYDNSSDLGGGIYCSGNSIITNCTICDNSAEYDGGVYTYYRSYSNTSITNCIIWGNDAINDQQLSTRHNPTYCCIQNWTGAGQGNIAENPYASSGTNYRLMPYSPCIDTGTNEPPGGLPLTDIDGNPRPLDGDGDGISVADMGAYECQELNSPLVAFIPIEFEFHRYIGLPNPQPQKLSIWNAGPGTLYWKITEDCNWLNTNPTAGQSTGDFEEVTLSIDANGLNPGSYSYILEITGPNGNDWLWNIPVNLFFGSLLSVPTQYTTIQSAIDAAADYDMVLVEDGIYTGDGNRDLDFHGKLITLKSTNGPNNCIIDSNGSEAENHRAFHFRTNETQKSIVDGFTLTNGYFGEGGGIYCENLNDPTIANCVITRNFARMGGGISCRRGSSPTITNCTFTGNSAEYNGGAITCFGEPNPINRPNINIINCTISDNKAQDRGGGFYCKYDIIATISDCVISNNSSVRGGGIFSEFSSLTIKNCTLTGNSAEEKGGALYCYDSDSDLTNCIIWANTAPDGPQIYLHNRSKAYVSYTDIDGGKDDIYVGSRSELYWGLGNIDADPCFIDPGYLDANGLWVDGDYHLLEDSPCINTGDPNYIPEPNETDLDGLPRVIDGRIDMGAYEYWPPAQAEMKFTPQTLNCKSKGNWLKAHLVLPDEISPEDIDLNEPAYAEILNTTIDSEYIKLLGSDNDRTRLEITFNRQAFCNLLKDNSAMTNTDTLEITVVGFLKTGRCFLASDTIKIKY